MSDALIEVAGRLCCPHCGAAMTADDRGVACAGGHRFDRARGGGVTLLPPGEELPPGDTPAMLEARDAFLRAGHYAPLTAALANAVPATETGCLVDAGAGTGHHTAGVLDARPGWWGIAVDASRTATRRAARAHERLAAVACDLTVPLPLHAGAADALLSVFSPRNGPEFARVVRPGGVLVVASAADDHLAEAREPLGLLGVQPDKRARLHARLGDAFVPSALEHVRFTLALEHDALLQLAGMGPAAFHWSPDDLAAGAAPLPSPFTVTASVTVETFTRR